MAREDYMPVNGQRIVFTDIETTGFSTERHEIIEIGAVIATHDLEIIDEIDIKIAPLHIENASPEALAVNGYTPEAWLGAVSLADAMNIYGEGARGAAFVAHNAWFDWKFIQRAFEKTELPSTLHGRRIDNIHFAKHLLKPEGLSTFSQKAVAEHLGIEPEPEIHRAVNGARLAHQIYKKLVER